MNIESFANILVRPYMRLKEYGGRFCGGPLYPENCIDQVRHKRGDGFYDEPWVGDLSLKTERVLSGEYLYFGALIKHHGHQVAEFVHRLWPLHDRCYKVLFVASDGYAHVSNFLYDYLQCLGVKDFFIVDEPIVVERLLVPDSGKFLNQDIKDWYLEKLNLFWSRKKNRLSFLPKKILVVRSHLQKGRIIGEFLIEKAFSRLGYFVFRPEEYSFIEQLGFYLAAEKIVFSEGSAMHTLDIAPKIKAKVLVLLRRSSSRLASDALRKRCERYLIYNDVFATDSLSRLGGEELSVVCIKEFIDSASVFFDEDFDSEISLSKADLISDIVSYTKAFGGRNIFFEKKMFDLYCQKNKLSDSDIYNKNQLGKLVRDLGKIFHISAYLEVGCGNGKFFFSHNFPFMHGFEKDVVLWRSDSGLIGKSILEMPYFDSEFSDSSFFDLILFHNPDCFSAVLSDFLDSFSCSSDKTIWVINNTCPFDYFSTISDSVVATDLRAYETGEIVRRWTGDVYKLIFYIFYNMSDLSYATIRSGQYSQTVVWRESRDIDQERKMSLEAISGLDYSVFLANKSIFNVVGYDTLIYRLQRC